MKIKITKINPDIIIELNFNEVQNLMLILKEYINLNINLNSVWVKKIYDTLNEAINQTQ